MADAELIGRFNKGEPAAFLKIHEILYNRILNFAKSIVEYETAKDIAQDSFIKLWLKHEDFDTLDQVTAFLFITTKNACIDYKRALAVQHLFKKESSYTSDEMEFIKDFELAGIEADILKKIIAAVNELPPAQRKVLKLALYDDLSDDEIAERLTMTKQVVWNMKSRALKTLKGIVNPNFIIISTFFMAVAI